MTKIKSSTDFNIKMGAELQLCVNELIEKILQELKNEIDAIVYGAGVPKIYERTYEFRESWEADTKKLLSNHIEGIVFENISILSYDPSTYTHGTKDGDNRENLADMIFKGYGYSFGGGREWFSKPRDAWSAIEKKLNSGYIDATFKSILRKRGLI